MELEAIMEASLEGKTNLRVLFPMVSNEADVARLLTPEQYRVARSRGTEPAFCGGLLKNKEPGVYRCVCCSLPEPRHKMRQCRQAHPPNQHR